MTPMEEALYAQVNAAVSRLREHGLYVRGTHPVDWGNDRRSGGNPYVLRGGSRLEPGDIQVIYGTFQVRLTPEDTFLVAYPSVGNQSEEQPFDTLDAAVEYIMAHWSGPPECKAR